MKHVLYNFGSYGLTDSSLFIKGLQCPCHSALYCIMELMRAMVFNLYLTVSSWLVALTPSKQCGFSHKVKFIMKIYLHISAYEAIQDELNVIVGTLGKPQ